MAALLALGLGGCNTFNDLFQGGPVKQPLPGERIAVLQAEQTADLEPGAIEDPVRLPRPQQNADWPEAGGYPDHAMHHLALPDKLGRAWSVEIGTGSTDEAHIMASPVVVGRRIFAMDSQGVVSAFDTATGKRVWKVDTKPEEEEAVIDPGGIAAAGGRLFVASGYAQVLALDLASGKVVWHQPVSAPMHAAPTIAGNRVYVLTIDNQVIALSADDGSRLWAHSGISETAGLLGGASPAVDGGTVIAPYSSGELFALRADTGRVAWNDSLVALRRADAVSALADIRARPVLDRGVVFAISHSGRAVAIDLRTGNRIWDREIASIQMPWVAGDWLYVLTTDNELMCLSRADGRTRWTRQLARWEDPEHKKDMILWAGPVLGGDRLIVVGSDGEALAVSPYTGRVLGRQAMPDRVMVPPVIADGTLYVLTEDAQLVAFR